MISEIYTFIWYEFFAGGTRFWPSFIVAAAWVGLIACVLYLTCDVLVDEPFFSPQAVLKGLQPLGAQQPKGETVTGANKKFVLAFLVSAQSFLKLQVFNVSTRRTNISNVVLTVNFLVGGAFWAAWVIVVYRCPLWEDVCRI